MSLDTNADDPTAHPLRPELYGRSSCMVFVLANHKGGCAKTTSVANVGVAFAQLGLRTLLIDADALSSSGRSARPRSRLGARR